MKLSRFSKIKLVKPDVYAVFNTLMMKVLFLSEEEKTALENLDFSPDDKKTYLECGIIVDDDQKDDLALGSVMREFEAMEKEIAVLYLILSSGCNLACRYCFIENSMYNNKCELNMSLDVVDAAVNKYCDYVKAKKIDKPLILFYGGEPLLNWAAIERTMSIVKSKGVYMEYSIVTNATLLDEDKVKFLAEHEVEIGISIDGPKDLNDKNRIYRNSSSSVYDKVTEKIQLLKKYNAKFGLSITVSQDLLDHKAEFFEWIKQYGVKDIFYNLYHFTDKAEWEDYYKQACQFLFESHEILSGLGIHDGRLQRKLDSFFDGSFKFADCASIGANQLTIKPNGDMCVCQGYHKSDQYVIGNIRDVDLEKLQDTDEFSFWVSRAPLKNPKCLDCEALFICGGGCAMQAEALFGNRAELDIPFCQHSKSALEWLLLRSYELALEDKN